MQRHAETFAGPGASCEKRGEALSGVVAGSSGRILRRRHRGRRASSLAAASQCLVRPPGGCASKHSCKRFGKHRHSEEEEEEDGGWRMMRMSWMSWMRVRSARKMKRKRREARTGARTGSQRASPGKRKAPMLLLHPGGPPDAHPAAVFGVIKTYGNATYVRGFRRGGTRGRRLPQRGAAERL